MNVTDRDSRVFIIIQWERQTIGGCIFILFSLRKMRHPFHGRIFNTLKTGRIIWCFSL
jgi:hypothetical protein